MSRRHARGARLAGLAVALSLGLGGACGPSSSSGGPSAWFEAWTGDGFPSLAEMVSGRPGSPTILEVNGGGVALFDGDGDGDLDVLLVIPGAYPAAGQAGGGSNRLYRNDMGRLVDVTAGSGVDVPGFCNGVAVGDVDADGRRDLYLTRLGPNVLLRATGPLRYEPVADAAGAAGSSWSTSAVFTDMDRDGDLDLYVVNYLEFDPSDPPEHGKDGRSCMWKNMPVMCGPQGLVPQADRYYRNDGGRFTDATEQAGFGVTPGYGLGVVDGDFDDDGWTDLYVSNDSTPNMLFLGQGDGTVRETGMLSGAALSARGREQAGMGIAAGDLDGDGDEDLMVTNFSQDSNALYVNEGDAFFSDEAEPAGIGGPSRLLLGWGVAFVDVDLDGDLDVVTANGHVYPQADAPGTDTSWAQPDRLWLNDGGGRFRLEPWAGDELRPSRALAAGDLDDDGVTDLLVTPLVGRPWAWRGTAGGESLQVRLQGPPGNPDAVGARVTWVDEQGERRRWVRTSGGYQAAADPRPLFAWRGPGELRVRWPDGSRSVIPRSHPGPVVLEAPAP